MSESTSAISSMILVNARTIMSAKMEKTRPAPEVIANRYAALRSNVIDWPLVPRPAAPRLPFVWAYARSEMTATAMNAAMLA